MQKDAKRSEIIPYKNIPSQNFKIDREKSEKRRFLYFKELLRGEYNLKCSYSQHEKSKL